MRLFGKGERAKAAVAVQTAPSKTAPFAVFDERVSGAPASCALYTAVREAVPLIDAAIYKLVRLTNGFKLECDCPRSQSVLDAFAREVPVGGNQRGMEAFIATYFEQLLTCGTAVGELVLGEDGRPCALWNAPLRDIELRRSDSVRDVDIYVRQGVEAVKVPNRELILLSVLNPEPGQLWGTSLLKGLPFLAGVLMNIFTAIGTNWERVGNVRFAVNYKPQNDALDRAYAKDRAMQIAREWSDTMRADAVRDFVAVGDVQIKVIGADNPILDSEVPVRQLLEQIVAKTGLPPFMLGLSWSSTERMSSQQADALTTELEAYRRILTPVIETVAALVLRSNGSDAKTRVVWDDITLQDRVEISRARYLDAQTDALTRACEDKERTDE